MTDTTDAARDEKFARNLADQCKTFSEWITVMRFGLPTLLENQPLLIEIICRRAVVDAETKQTRVSDEVRNLFCLLGLKLADARPAPRFPHFYHTMGGP